MGIIDFAKSKDELTKERKRPRYIKNLVSFVIYKGKIIEEGTGIKYFNRDDITEINRWPDMECQRIYLLLKNNIVRHDAYGAFTNTCIWCIKHSGKCTDCGYGNRHGKCLYQFSLYMKYRKKAITLLDNYKYRDMIRKIDDLH